MTASENSRPAVVAWLGYGAVILSFVGALHWGVAMVHPATVYLLGQGMPQGA